jgi:activating signal cointegrator complex subunit 3
MQYLNRTLAADFNISQLISVLSHAKEFAGLPVRHNEDVLNEALTHLVPLKVNKHNLEDPHVKANLLL